MRYPVFGGFVSCLLIGLATSAAPACINDREVGNSEREFKSNYQPDYPEQPTLQSPDSGRDQLMAFGATGLGSVLLIGATVITLKRPS
jgi:hypothetical protein